MQATSIIIKKFELNCKKNDSILMDAVIGNIGIYIADFHLELPNILAHPNILVISTKNILVSGSMSFMRVDDVKAALVTFSRLSISKMAPFQPSCDDLFLIPQHSKYVLSEHTIANMNLVDEDLLVDELVVVRRMFVYK
eukprot:NODE_138_length_17968_cov_0.291175.p8 type:complete len:139 gc:universal NODE_138_length_17968_cov_0.291175:15989-15573(-)